MTSLRGSLLGAERPRAELRPTGVDTLGPLAAELGERAGVVLEPWQRDSLDMLLSTRADGKWACYEYCEICSRRNGKTQMLLVRALFGFLLLRETPILWTAQEVKTSMRAWRDFRTMLFTLGVKINDNLVDLGGGVLIRINASNGKEGFERLDTEQELKMIARSKDSGRGFDADFLVVDEAYDFTAVQQDALAPTQMARPNAQVAYASSPPLDGNASEALYRLRRRAQKATGARLGWRDWGRPESLDEVLMLSQEELDAFLDDPAVRASANPALGGPRVTAETIQNMRDSMTEAGYAREVLGCWPRQADADAPWPVIPEIAWTDRGTADAQPDGPCAIAIAASFPDAGRVAIDVAGRSRGELVVQVARHDAGTSWVVAEVQRLRDTWRPFAVVLDPKGPAGVLQAPLEKAGIEMLLVGANEAAAAAGTLYDAVAGDAPYLTHCGQPDLDTAVATADKRPLGDAWRFRRCATSAPLEAAALAVWAVVARERRPPSPPRAVPALTGGGPETADLDRIGF